MRLLVLAVGKLREAWVREGVREYQGRLRHYLPADVVEVADENRLLERLPARHDLVVLDERGDLWTSAELARFLADRMAGGTAGVAFAIGGPEGFGAAVRKAGRLLALSRLTLPHRLCRVVLLEQLYRAMTILRGEPYHK